MTQSKHADNVVRQYHNTTKHTLQRYAKGPETLDWDDQPEAFRWFNGCPKTNLPLVADQLKSLYLDIYKAGTIKPQSLTLNALACLLELSFGLSAWKQYGEARWALRCNPSSGNLHAEEAYVICNDINGVESGVYHYLSRDHQLEQRCIFGSPQLPDHTLLLGISSIQWREAWKYGERAYRYCQLDTGHAIAALRYAAAALGWRVQLVNAVSDRRLAALLGICRQQDFGAAEPEHPDVLLHVTTTNERREIDIDRLLDAATGSVWQGQANRLSPRHMYDWSIIDRVSEATAKPGTATPTENKQAFLAPLEGYCALEAATLFRRRRSAQAFDGQTPITCHAFYRILDMTLPRHDAPPWDCTPWRDSINLVLFVHRIDGLKPGLYTLIRNPRTFDSFKTALGREQFLWQTINNAPAHLPLYELVLANGQNLATTLSCHQAIAGQSCFSLGMIANTSVIEETPWHYRRLYWEAGMIGQVLYLEAEAADLQGTGIGCYFDDAVHDVLGITDTRWQSLYHFTVGKGLRDARIQTLPPYAHLANR